MQAEDAAYIVFSAMSLCVESRACQNAKRIYCYDSLWNFVTFTFTGKENKDFHRPVMADRLIGGGARSWPVRELHGSSQA